MSFLKTLIAASKNKYASIAADGIEGSDVTGFIDTGSYAFNALVSGSIYNGIPNNKITVLAGESATGKTFFALGIIKSFLDADKEATVIYFDSESAVTSEMFAGRGIDLNRVAVLGADTVENFRNQTIQIANTYVETPEKDRKPLLIVLDSLGNLSSEKEMADTAEGKNTLDMTRAKMVKAAFRVLTLKLGQAKIPLVVTNHTYSEIGSMYPRSIMGGGTGLRYCGSIVVFLSKRKEKDGDNVVIGNVIHCKLDKGRFTKENSMVDVLLRYDTGLNKYYGLIEIAEKYGIFKKVSTRFEMPDGTKVFESAIIKTPEKYFTKEILKQIDEAAGKEFKYGSDQGPPPETEEDGEDEE
jgi:RecA/RadA recombinase